MNETQYIDFNFTQYKTIAYILYNLYPIIYDIIVKLVECNWEIDEREAKAKEC